VSLFQDRNRKAHWPIQHIQNGLKRQVGGVVCRASCGTIDEGYIQLLHHHHAPSPYRCLDSAGGQGAVTIEAGSPVIQKGVCVIVRK
jgi:hypothetical protein